MNGNGTCELESEDIDSSIGCDVNDCQGLPDITSPRLCIPPNYFVGIDGGGNIICNDYCDPGLIYGLDEAGTVLCTDCNGDYSGTAYMDNCATCVGGNTGQTECVADCNGDYGGTAYIDNCEICVGGNTGVNSTCNNKIVFVSSATYNGNLGGVSGADGKCQTLATAAGLNGVYKAWISDITSSVGNRFTQYEVPYILVDGTMVITGWQALTTGIGELLHAINKDEYGNEIIRDVWTSTDDTGYYFPFDIGSCNNWGQATSDIFAQTGNSGASTIWWTRKQGTTCDNLFSIYCFEQ